MNSIFKMLSFPDAKIDGLKIKAVKELNSFFSANWKPEQIKIFFVDDRKTIDELSGYETKDWVVGFYLGFNNVVLLNPATIESESIHKYSDKNYYKLIKHEICHMYLNAIFGKIYFRWIEEGVCVYVSGQAEKVKEFKKFLGKDFSYTEAGYAFKLLADKFGEETIYEFLKKQSGREYQNDMENAFEKVFGSKPTYEYFNGLLK